MNPKVYFGAMPLVAVGTSGHSILGEESRKRIKRAEPLPMPPPHMLQARPELVVPMQFHTRWRTRIRRRHRPFQSLDISAPINPFNELISIKFAVARAG